MNDELHIIHERHEPTRRLLHLLERPADIDAQVESTNAYNRHHAGAAVGLIVAVLALAVLAWAMR
jgi:hypothetical protein